MASEEKAQVTKSTDEAPPKVEDTNGQAAEPKKKNKKKKKKNKGISDFMEDAEEAKAFQQNDDPAPAQEKENTSPVEEEEAPKPSKKEEKLKETYKTIENLKNSEVVMKARDNAMLQAAPTSFY